MARSDIFPTLYRVGSIEGCDVYWHPAQGYAVDYHFGLVEITDLSEVEFLDRVEDYEALVDAADSNAGLLHAMGRDLVKAFYDMADDMVFADKCETEKRATLRQASIGLGYRKDETSFGFSGRM